MPVGWVVSVGAMTGSGEHLFERLLVYLVVEVRIEDEADERKGALVLLYRIGYRHQGDERCLFYRVAESAGADRRERDRFKPVAGGEPHACTVRVGGELGLPVAAGLANGAPR